ncbi:phosphopantetheine-binding protein (plasmid) [Streptomyces sp. DSM 116496]|uniref:phosphopantetheine-binding protein n=1 Tax=Streptomyces stoeckheimensis TaxID=3344656 RepID=UPI0038B3C680
MTEQTPHGRFGQLPDLDALRAMSIDARTRTIGHCLRLELEHLLAVPPGHRISPRLPLRSQGLDPLNALHLERRIRRVLHTEVTAEVLRESTVTELAGLLAR